MGWKCLYAPYAKGYHVRKALPGNRRALPAEINMHSVKNRFLLRMKNMTWDLYRRNFFSITARDIVVIGCCLVWEHTSLKAFPFPGPELEERDGEAPRDHASPARGRRIHGELVRLPTGQQARAEEVCRFALTRSKAAAPLANLECASRFWERAAFRPTTADSRPSRKSFPSGLPPAATRSTSTAGSATTSREYRGVQLVYLPTIHHKYFDTLAHTFLSTLHLLAHRVDAALYCNAANALFTILPRMLGHTRRAECGWHRAQAPEVECASREPGIRFRNIFRRSCRTGL